MKRMTFICILILLALSACGTPATPTAIPTEVPALSPEELQDAIFKAAREKDIEAMKTYIAAGADINATNSIGTTVLNVAAYGGDAEMIKLLLDSGAEFSEDVFFLAISNSGDNIEIVQAFIDHGADIHSPEAGIPEHTPLMYAAQFGQVEVGKFLLAQGVDINAVDAFNDPALNVAAFNGQLEFAKMLVEMGAELNVRGFSDHTALGHAISQNHPEVAEYLISVGAIE